MTLIQLEYIIALDTYRHFALAAEHCFVSQPTLSMQLQKAEEEFGVRIFDRSKKPLVPTELGAQLIEQARKIVGEAQMMKEIADQKKGIISGELKIGIIPTLAPYLLPLFIQSFSEKYPLIKIIITELTTQDIISCLKNGKIDVGLLVTPLLEPGIREIPLFFEELKVYVSKSRSREKKVYIAPKDIDPSKLWLLEEGHCFRSQIENLCQLRKAGKAGNAVQYESGSIETLRRMVETNDGITILPQLATLDMTELQLEQVRPFKKPVPMRQVSIITHRDYIKKKLIEALKREIVFSLPDNIKSNKGNFTVPVVPLQ